MLIAAACAAVPPNSCMEAKPLRLAGDTNLLLDLDAGDEDVLDAVAVIDVRLPVAEWLVSPSVLDELAFLADDEMGEGPVAGSDQVPGVQAGGAVGPGFTADGAGGDAADGFDLELAIR